MGGNKLHIHTKQLQKYDKSTQMQFSIYVIILMFLRLISQVKEKVFNQRKLFESQWGDCWILEAGCWMLDDVGELRNERGDQNKNDLTSKYKPPPSSQT